MDLYTLLNGIMIGCEMLPLLIALSFLAQKKEVPFRWILLTATAFIGGTYELTADLFPEGFDDYWYYIFTVFETAGIIYFFSPYTSKWTSIALIGVTLLFTLLLFSNISKEMNMYRFGWVCLMQLALTLFCIFQWGKDRFQNLPYPSLFDDPDFFAIIGLVIYLSVCSFYYLLYPYMIQFPNDNLLFYWIILPVSIAMYGALLAWGVVKQNKA